jgi:hypothetical protein
MRVLVVLSGFGLWLLHVSRPAGTAYFDCLTAGVGFLRQNNLWEPEQ